MKTTVLLSDDKLQKLGKKIITVYCHLIFKLLKLL